MDRLPPRRSRYRRPCPAPRRSDPAGSAQSMPGSARRWFRIGSTRPTARPERNARNRGAQGRKRRGHRVLRRSRRGHRPTGSPAASIAAARSASAVTPQLLVQQRQLFERDRARLVEPPEVRREVGDRRLEEHPGPRLVHVAERPQHGGVGLGRRMVEDGGQVGVGFEMRAREPALRRSSAGAPRRHRRGCGRARPAAKASPRRRRPIVRQVLESRR